MSNASDPSRSKRRWLRANNIIGKCVPPLVLLFMWKGWKLCTFEIGIDYLTRKQCLTVLGPLYITSFNVIFVPTVVAYLRVYFAPANHSIPPREPPLSVREKRVVHEVDGPDGQVRRCWRDDCRGRWKPSKTRHCGSCGVCRTEFDHHCPWFDGCISSSTLRPFLISLLLAPPLIFLGVAPILSLFRAHLAAVVRSSATAPWIRSVWWDRWWSWVPGPVGWWAIRVGLGFWRWDGLPGRGVDEPRADVALMVLCGVGISLIALGLLYTTLSGIFSSSSTIDVQRARSYNALQTALAALASPSESSALLAAQNEQKHHDLDERSKALDPRVWVWVPLEGVKGRVVRTRAEDRVWDLGCRRNWEEAVGRGLFGARTSDPTLPRLSPTVMERLQREAERSAFG